MYLIEWTNCLNESLYSGVTWESTPSTFAGFYPKCRECRCIWMAGIALNACSLFVLVIYCKTLSLSRSTFMTPTSHYKHKTLGIHVYISCPTVYLAPGITKRSFFDREMGRSGCFPTAINPNHGKFGEVFLLAKKTFPVNLVNFLAAWYASATHPLGQGVLPVATHPLEHGVINVTPSQHH